jgi:sugar/nucleoside kinase (ribokinase family)
VITGVTEIAHITTKQDMSRWTRAHADVAGITWSVFAGPGGTMIIVEHAEDRCSANRANPSPEAAPAASPAERPVDTTGAFPVSALRAA